MARTTAESSGRPEDIQHWRKCVAILHKEILSAKRNCFNNFISKTDYRKDGKNVYNYVNNLLSNKIRSTREPLKFGSRVLTDGRDISNTFNSFYSSRQYLNTDRKTQQKSIRREHSHSAFYLNSGHDIFYKNNSMLKLIEAVKRFKSGKSLVPNNFNPEFPEALWQQRTLCTIRALQLQLKH
ncbi:hypothetical protein TNCT_189541 [Trichonephila clavata]|uniref:Uncharacterized protein n=1 Tax=Trichonephila clavata TaxID=2740835 RepID=A0A8X6H2Z8_TRICU|nr:hypothetical protein TNCT_189541 [Trichonephila clavata]